MSEQILLSVIIITKNAGSTVERCLESFAALAGEIVVLDSGSTDDTVAICRRYTSNVHVSNDWPGFGAQKNRVLSLATGRWVLSLDADEWLSPALREEIAGKISVGSPPRVYAIPRLSSFCGKFMRYSGWYPDYVERLFPRGVASFTNDIVHERLDYSGTAAKMKHPLLHAPFESLEQVVDKMDRYSTAGAVMRWQRGDSAGLPQALAHGFWSFLHTYVIKLGFLDGKWGFILAVANAEGTYYRYLKLMLLGQQK